MLLPPLTPISSHVPDGTFLCSGPGFWILFSTQVGITDGFVRMVTDLVWSGSGFARRVLDVRTVYYGAMVIFVLWGSFYLLRLREILPGQLILLGANFAGVNFVIMSLHQLYLNRRFLPRELRPALWRELVLVATALFFVFFSVATLAGIGLLPFLPKF